MPDVSWIAAAWPAPPRVRAGCTTRLGGYSGAPYASLNLGGGCGDQPGRVRANRARLRRLLGLPNRPCWLSQEHGRRIVEAHAARVPPRADGSYTRLPGRVCAVLTADCAPLLLCDRAGTRVAAVHVGWRGLLAGAPEAGLRAMRTAPVELLAWIGPCIGRDCFTVGEEVATAFRRFSAAGRRALRRGRPRSRLDLPLLLRLRLRELGVGSVYSAARCTACHPELYYSHRRDGARTGRMAGLIWLAEASQTVPRTVPRASC